MAAKSLLVTYLLWFFGGIFGLHHFYLNRDYHALIWWMFAGGYFGAGWLRDLWRIPEYVRDANEDPSYMTDLAHLMWKYHVPPTGYFRYVGLLVVADTFGFLILNAFPKELFSEYALKIIGALFVPAACSFGIYLVGNVGRHQGRIKPVLIAAYLTAPLYFYLDSPIFITSLFGCYVFNSYSKEWRRTPRPKKSFGQRLTFFVICGTIYLLLWSSWLYFNCRVTYQNEGEVKCKDAAKHFFKSPIWREFVNVMKELFKSIRVHGWREVWKQIIEAFDPVGEVNALKTSSIFGLADFLSKREKCAMLCPKNVLPLPWFKFDNLKNLVLGLHSNATQQEIRSRYHKLSREWHPDKHKDLEMKEEAQEKFIEIQNAYEVLSKIKSQRVAQNIKNSDDKTVEHDDL